MRTLILRASEHRVNEGFRGGIQENAVGLGETSGELITLAQIIPDHHVIRVDTNVSPTKRMTRICVVRFTKQPSKG